MFTPDEAYDDAVYKVACAICRYMKADPQAPNAVGGKPNWKAFEPQAKAAVDALELKDMFEQVYDAERLMLDVMVSIENHEITNQMSSDFDKVGYLHELCKKMADPRSRN